MATKYNDEDLFVNSIIGEGTVFKGEFDLNGLLRIDGTFTGEIRTEGKVLIGQKGQANCNIRAGEVVIGGKVRGNINARERITLLSTGELIGNISTPRLVIEEGVIFDGKCTILHRNGASKLEWKELKGIEEPLVKKESEEKVLK